MLGTDQIGERVLSEADARSRWVLHGELDERVMEGFEWFVSMHYVSDLKAEAE